MKLLFFNCHCHHFLKIGSTADATSTFFDVLVLFIISTKNKGFYLLAQTTVMQAKMFLFRVRKFFRTTAPNQLTTFMGEVATPIGNAPLSNRS